MTKRKLSLLIFGVIVLTLGISISVQSLIAAWQAPTSAPPGSNVAAPLNVGNQTQAKTGLLKAEGGLVIETRTNTPASPTDGRIWLQQ